MIKTKRFVVLDAFRGIAATLVFLYHMPDLTWLTSNAFIKHSGVFVDLFFVLSGFVIYHNYKERLCDWFSAKQFLIKRFKRIVPLHVYALLVLFCLEVFKLLTYSSISYGEEPFTTNNLEGFFVQLFMLNSTPLHQNFNWNGPNWSISAEMISYVVFAVLSLVVLKKKWLKLLASVIIIVLGFGFFYFNFNTFNIKIDYGFSFLRALIGFNIGVLTYELMQFFKPTMQKIKPLFWHIAEFIVAIYLIFIIVNIYDYIDHFYVLHIGFAALMLVYSQEKGIISKVLQLNLFERLGLWSYSIYLNHMLFVIVFKVAVKQFNFDGFYLVLSEFVVISLVIFYSSITYNFIEKRFYKR